LIYYLAVYLFFCYKTTDTLAALQIDTTFDFGTFFVTDLTTKLLQLEQKPTIFVALMLHKKTKTV
jgi:hypothetical protein